MNISAQSFEVLQTLGYPVYVRRSILEELRQSKTKQVKVKPKRISESEPETAIELALQVSAKNDLVSSKPKHPEIVKWPDFHIAVSGAPGEVLVIFDIPEKVELQGKASAGLIDNLLGKCGIEHKTSFHKEFHWPLFASNSIDQSAALAVKALASLAHREQVIHSFQWILIFGKNSVSCTLNKNINEILGTQTEYLGVPAIASLSVQDLLIDPALRTITWQHVLPLRDAFCK